MFFRLVRDAHRSVQSLATYFLWFLGCASQFFFMVFGDAHHRVQSLALRFLGLLGMQTAAYKTLHCIF